ncbi:MAG: hypothetical protein DRJ51_05825 [Thermoprotei archaeon]|nr:MAG: hypothetical protein DRJ51_05825 [Thermoprotei archaeon]RLF02394.1 MAG: hypothetical protein DRJ59_03705 [Thermoprotei archaeon]
MARAGPPVILVWLDCLAGDVFVNMYKNGELPNLSSYFENGIFIENVISCFPTVSESAEGGIISGFFSGETNMVGERYFSRKLRMIRHYKLNARAEMDFNARLKKRTIDTVIGETVAMGRIIRTSRENIDDVKALKHEREGSLEIVERRLEVASRIVLLKRPKLLFFTISADYISHVNGRDGGAVKRFIEEFDRRFPILVESLNKAYGRDNYAIFIFSDHGSASVAKHLDLPQLLEEEGFNPATADLLMERRDVDSAALSNGRRMGLVYFAHPKYGWRRKLSYKQLRNYPHKGRNLDLLELFAQLEGVEQVFAKRDQKSVVIVSKDGEGVIQYDPASRKYKYSVLRGSDPLGYELEPRWMGEEEWLRNTFKHEYPDAIVQLYHIFKSKNCGDIVLNAAPNWDFWEPWDISYPILRAAHGGLSKDEMMTFILAKGPGMRRVEIKCARLIDIFATIATYYGAKDLVADTHAVERMLGSATAR